MLSKGTTEQSKAGRNGRGGRNSGWNGRVRVAEIQSRISLPFLAPCLRLLPSPLHRSFPFTGTLTTSDLSPCRQKVASPSVTPRYSEVTPPWDNRADKPLCFHPAIMSARGHCALYTVQLSLVPGTGYQGRAATAHRSAKNITMPATGNRGQTPLPTASCSQSPQGHNRARPSTGWKRALATEETPEGPLRWRALDPAGQQVSPDR